MTEINPEPVGQYHHEWQEVSDPTTTLFLISNMYSLIDSYFSESTHTHPISDITTHGWVDKTDQLNSAIQTYCTFEVNEALRLAQLSYTRSNLTLANGTTTSNVGIPSTYRPEHPVRQPFSNNIYYTLWNKTHSEAGNISFGNEGSSTTPSLNFQIMWHY